MDRFDDIWKNRFNESSIPDEDWSTPDDSVVWDNIAQHLPQEKKRRRFIWFWWVLGLFIVLMVTWGVVQMNYKGKIVAAEKIESKPITQQSSLIQMTEDEICDLYINKPEMAIDSEKKLKIVQNSNFKLENIGKKKSTNSTVITSKKNNENRSINQSHVANTIIKNIDISTIDIEMEGQKAIFNLDPIPVIQIKDLVFNEKKSLKTNVMPPNEEAKKQLKINLSLNAGGVFWQHRISDQYTSDLSPFDFNYKDDWGWQANLLATIEGNKYFSPFIGVQYENINVTSGHNSTLNYSTANEQGTNENIYTQNLATPYGLSEATFRLNRNEDLVDEMVDLTVDFKSNHQIKNLSTPIGLKIRPLGTKHKLQLDVSIGIGINYLLDIQNSLRGLDTNHDFIQYSVDNPASFNNPIVEKWHYDTRLGFEGKYLINEKLQLNLQYNWVHGLNSIFQLDNYSTKIDRYQISIGIVQSIL